MSNQKERDQLAKTIIEKIWDEHVVYEEEGKPDLLYIDLHLLHEVTSPQAFEGLRLNNRKVRRPDFAMQRWIITYQLVIENKLKT